MSSLPRYYPPPHCLTPSQMLELTPSPPHTPSPHSPISPQSQPIIIRHETPPANTDRKLVFSAENLKPEGLPSGYPPLDKLVIDCLSTSSEGGEEREEEEGGGHTRDGDEMEKGNKCEGEENQQVPPQQVNRLPLHSPAIAGWLVGLSSPHVLTKMNKFLDKSFDLAVVVACHIMSVYLLCWLICSRRY